MKKCTLLICIFLTTNTLILQTAFASRGTLLTRFLRLEIVSRLLAQRFAGKISLMQADRLSPKEKQDISSVEGNTFASKEKVDVMQLFSGNKIDEASRTPIKNLDDILDQLNLAIFSGDISTYRESMLALLNVPYGKILELGWDNIMSRKVVKMMYKHPERSVRQLFRRELYDLLNLFANKKIFDIPEEHSSIYKDSIPVFVFEETELGQAIVQDNIAKFYQAWNQLISEASLKVMLAHNIAEVKTARNIRNLVIREMSAENVFRLRDFDEANNVIPLKIKHLITKLDPNEQWIPILVGAGGGMGSFILTAAMLTESVGMEAAKALIIGFMASFVGIMPTVALGTDRVLRQIRKAR